MVAPSVRALGAFTSGSTASPTFAAPAGAQPDDVILITWFQDDARTTIDLGALPTGFGVAPDLRQFNANLGSPDHSLFGFYGRRSAVGAGPYTFTVVPGIGNPTPFCEGAAAAIRDCTLAANPFAAADGNTTGSSNATVAPPVSASSGGTDRFAFYAATNWNTGAWTAPTDFTKLADSTNRLLTYATETLPTATTVNPQATCASSARMNAWVGIFLPLAGAVVTGSAAVPLGDLNVAAIGQRVVLGAATVDLNGLSVNAVGQRVTNGVATINLGNLVTSASAITGGPIILPDDMYRPGPCHNYEWVGCTIPLDAAAVSGTAVAAASEILYYASGQRFDSCQVTIRPCRKECYGDGWPRLAGGWWEFGTWPQPLLYAGSWYNIACGFCGTGCSCSIVSETILPGPVQEIVQVTVDGEVLVEGTDYRLDDYRKLVRLGGNLWPLCNDLNKSVTDVGTWSVTAIYGEPFPNLGKLAMGQLVCQIIADLVGNDCTLPDNVTNITRQGLSFTLQDVNDLVQEGFEPLTYVNRFIERYNPNKLQGRARLYDVDGPDFRVTGTTI